MHAFIYVSGKIEVICDSTLSKYYYERSEVTIEWNEQLYDSGETGKSMTGLIIGLAVGITTFLLIVVVILIWMKSKRKNGVEVTTTSQLQDKK